MGKFKELYMDAVEDLERQGLEVTEEAITKHVQDHVEAMEARAEAEQEIFPMPWELESEERCKDGHSYGGYVYSSFECGDDDCQKFAHFATRDGKEIYMDWSPYSAPTHKDFALWIELGLPERTGRSREELLKQAEAKGLRPFMSELRRLG